MKIVVAKEKSKYGEAVFIRVMLEKMDNDLDVRFANRMCGEVGFFVDEEKLAWLISELQHHLKQRTGDTADWSCESCGFENHSVWRKCGNCETPRR